MSSYRLSFLQLLQAFDQSQVLGTHIVFPIVEQSFALRLSTSYLESCKLKLITREHLATSRETSVLSLPAIFLIPLIQELLEAELIDMRFKTMFEII
jgi:hypothetical protein